MRTGMAIERLGVFGSVLALALFCFAGCGDDEPADTGSGDLADVRDDSPQVDVIPDQDEPQTDPVVDLPAEVDDSTVEEETTPTTETDCENGEDDDRDGLTDCSDLEDCVCEVCNDLVDNDEDQLVDCADSSCSDDPLCPEWCGNQEDDDGDGDVDCDDSECATAGRCVDEPTTPDTYVFSDLLSYFYHLQYPPGDTECCFDFTGDGVPDNELARILGSIPSYDAQTNMSASINMGDLVLLIEWVDLPQDMSTAAELSFNIFRGVAIIPPPPEYLTQPIGPETNIWADGEGAFQVTRDSFDDRGPRIRFDAAELGTAIVRGETPSMAIAVPIEALGVDLSLTLRDVQVEAHLQRIVHEDLTVEIRTVPQEIPVDEDTLTVGGGKLGGYILADDIFTFFNAGAELCACAKPSTATGLLMSFGERPAPSSDYQAQCNWTPYLPNQQGYTCTGYESPLCAHLNEICALALIIPYILDVDANQNDITESVSAGLFFDVSGAHLANPPVTSD